MRREWKNEIYAHIERTISRIQARNFKKMRSGRKNLMDRNASILRMLNETEEKCMDFIQEAYMFIPFLMS